MIPMPNSGLLDPVKQGARYGFGAGAAFAVRSLGCPLAGRRARQAVGRYSRAKRTRLGHRFPVRSGSRQCKTFVMN
jgi:hypothetical protein